ncbi:MAG: glycogen/starch/alpha-glucan phosphorylase [Planctomycetes bacterium]|nr:glycogen/starch/alpha-glucan phosphorylase [Planctomycetota bacterium]
MISTTSIPTARQLRDSIARYARYSLGLELEQLTPRDVYLATSLALREVIIDGLLATERRVAAANAKRVYYLSVEFLLGRVLDNNLLNLGLHDTCAEALRMLGSNLEELEELEPDPALGNGGLGRLAACFLDSMASLGVPGYGYGINYEFGLFRQTLKDGAQEEQPDEWRSRGTPWLLRRPDLTCRVPIFGAVEETRSGDRSQCRWIGFKEVLGVPSDLPVVGYAGRSITPLRLFAAQASEEFDMAIFNAGDYLRAVEQKIQSERISKVLYPADNSPAGRELRLIQEYFFVACSLKDILKRHLKSADDVKALPDRIALQLNDTHPALAVAELVRVLQDDWNVPFDDAFELTRRTVAFTNHTLLPEALERWPVAMLERVIPRHLRIIYAINERLLDTVGKRWPGDTEKQRTLSLIGEDGEKHARMAHLAIAGSHSVNGVSTLHGQLIKTRLVPQFHELWPERFNAKTNGVTQRRWLLKTNPALARLLSELVGDGWITDLDRLRGLEPFAQHAEVQSRFLAIRRAHKERLARIIRDELGITIDPASTFDAHVKRIHEYKRQLMNALRIGLEYVELVDDGKQPVLARTYLFAGKAAPGYVAAKTIIRFIHAVAAVVNSDPRTRDVLRVAYLPDYRVTLAERIIPATDLSAQISTAGMEASGTGNMKFMMNGALTVGTLDGANIEMQDEAGADNMFIFGLTAEQVELRRAQPRTSDAAAARDPRVKRVLAAVKDERFGGGAFKELIAKLEEHDPYFVLADLPLLLDAQTRVAEVVRDPARFAHKALLNVARSGPFSSDRTIRDYAREIWDVPVDLA